MDGFLFCKERARTILSILATRPASDIHLKPSASEEAQPGWDLLAVRFGGSELLHRCKSIAEAALILALVTDEEDKKILVTLGATYRADGLSEMARQLTDAIVPHLFSAASLKAVSKAFEHSLSNHGRLVLADRIAKDHMQTPPNSCT